MTFFQYIFNQTLKQRIKGISGAYQMMRYRQRYIVRGTYHFQRKIVDAVFFSGRLIVLQWSNKSQKWGNFIKLRKGLRGGGDFSKKKKYICFFFMKFLIFLYLLVFSPKMLRNTSNMAFKSKQAKQSISMGKFQNFRKGLGGGSFFFLIFHEF